MGKKRQQQRNGGNQQNAGQVNGVGEDGRRKESLMQKFKGKAGDGDGDGDGDGGLTAAALAATNELLATAKELYRSLGGGSEDDGGDGDDEGDEGDENALGGDAAYWRALPRRLRSGELTDAEFASRVREAAAALVPASTAAKEIISEALSSPDKMPPPPPPPPSSVSIGKKPMAYQQPAPAPPRSARAAAKAPVPAPPPPEPGKGKAAQQAPGTHGAAAANNSNNKIWSTSSSEERERIRDFWLALAEDERRDLVRVEKDTVLRKMKEEQKHSCSCAVCGRKRTAIEDELQVLYDAYYEDLEQYALYQQQYLSSNRTLPPPPGPGPFPGSVEVDRYGAVVAGFPPLTLLDSLSPKPNTPNNGNNGGKNRRARRRRKPAPTNTDRNPNNRIFNANARNEDDVYEEPDTKDEDKDEDENPDGVDMKYKIGAGVKGPISIPTVADDLLNDDGRRFLEMMEQLAERRLAREEEGVNGDEDDSTSFSLDGVGDGSSDGEDVMDEQKMEEGKRMFSIFAARMFEQRILQAYREHVAQKQQQLLLHELQEEDKREREKEAKKLNQTKKDKKR